MIRRKLTIAILALGTLGGFASGFASMGACGRARRASFEEHVARLCVDAARTPPPAGEPATRGRW
jgi:hypothetical protein